MKKLICSVMALIMALSLCIPAVAADETAVEDAMFLRTSIANNVTVEDISVTTPNAETSENNTDMENPRYLTTDEVLRLTQYHIDGYMASDSQTAGRDITASEQFIDLYDTSDELFAYIVPLMEEGANIGYITMPAKNSGATFYEIYIEDGIVDNIRNCTAYVANKSSDAADSKLYFIPPYSYVFATDKSNNATYYELRKSNMSDVEIVDISNDFSLSVEQSTYTERVESINEKITNILQPGTRAMAVRVEDVRLSHESDFVPVGDNYYGGDQAWYEDSKADNGCGPVAAANITYYLDKQSSLAISGLYSYSNITKNNFTKHMNTLYSYCSPKKWGDTSLTEWADDVVAYADDCGVDLYPVYTSMKATFENSCSYIKNGLRIDSPVATLNLDLSWSYGWHWMTITKYYRGTADDRYVAVSTWGKRVSINYETLYDSMSNSFGISGIFESGLIYFN